jgi:hypothetical protein
VLAAAKAAAVGQRQLKVQAAALLLLQAQMLLHLLVLCKRWMSCWTGWLFALGRQLRKSDVVTRAL